MLATVQNMKVRFTYSSLNFSDKGVNNNCLLSHSKANEQEKANLKAIKGILLLYSFPLFNFSYFFFFIVNPLKTGLESDTLKKFIVFISNSAIALVENIEVLINCYKRMQNSAS